MIGCEAALGGPLPSGDDTNSSEPLVELSAAFSDYAGRLPRPELERLSHDAGVDACSLTDNQIAEALFQLR
jgi:hypothetical protein